MAVATEEAGIPEDLVFRWLAARSMSAESRRFGDGSLRPRRKARFQGGTFAPRVSCVPATVHAET